jgi:carbonic anhydrase
MPSDFDDLLAANQTYADAFENAGLDGVARAGIGIVTCIDSRIDPLAILGLRAGDAKIVRNPGGRATPSAMDALVLGVHLLGVKRILIIPHTRCAVASSTERELMVRLSDSAGEDASWLPLPVTDDQAAALEQDVHRVRAHPLIPDSVLVGGFVYDVETGLLEQRL